jgi:pimeloyl-ACP methyl ester carboxylesterase
LSDPLPGASFRSVAEDIVILLQSLELRSPALIGFSGGGPFALACAAALPADVRRLVLVGSVAPLAETPLMQTMSERSRQLFTLAAGDRIQFESALAGITADPLTLAEAARNGASAVDGALFDVLQLRAAYEASCAHALRQGPGAILRDLALLTRPWDFDLREIRCPVALWHGLADDNIPAAMSEALAAAIPNASLKLIPDAGHWFLWRRWPDVLAAAV